MEILSPKGHDLLRCMDDQKKKSVNHYRPLPTICERGCYVVNNYFFCGQPLSTITNNFFAPIVAIAAVVIANTVSNRIEDN